MQFAGFWTGEQPKFVFISRDERQGNQDRDCPARQDHRLRLEPAGRQRGQDCRDRVRAHLNVISNIGYNNTQALLSQLARAHAQFIIAHASGYDTAAKQVAQQYHVPVMTYDIPNELVPGLVSNITTSSQQGAYLAGILAARMTKTKTGGIVISASDTNWYEMSGGFAAGVHSVNPKSRSGSPRSAPPPTTTRPAASASPRA